MIYIFDLGGVLAELDVTGFIHRFSTLLKPDVNFGMSEEELTRGGGASFLHDYELGQISTREILDYFHSKCREDVTDEQLRKVWLSELKPIPEQTKFLLRHLHRKGHEVFLLSNTNDMHWEYVKCMFEENGYHLIDFFDHIFLSYQLGMSKPDDDIYKEVMKYISDEQCVVYIDDSEKNRLAGEHMGWQTFDSIESLVKNMIKQEFVI